MILHAGNFVKRLHKLYIMFIKNLAGKTVWRTLSLLRVRSSPLGGMQIILLNYKRRGRAKAVPAVYK